LIVIKKQGIFFADDLWRRIESRLNYAASLLLLW
jgi:hypothetical protein